jgi:hypothetical protein
MHTHPNSWQYHPENIDTGLLFPAIAITSFADTATMKQLAGYHSLSLLAVRLPYHHHAIDGITARSL